MLNILKSSISIICALPLLLVGYNKTDIVQKFDDAAGIYTEVINDSSASKRSLFFEASSLPEKIYVSQTQKENTMLFEKLRSNASLTWETAAKVLGKDFSLCDCDTHQVYVDTSFSNSYVILQSDLCLYEDYGVVGVVSTEELAAEQKKKPLCLETVTVFLDITGTADEDKLYEYRTDFESESDVRVDLVGQSRLNTYDCEINFYYTEYNQLIACVAYDDCLFEISYGIVDAENIFDSIDLICSGFE